MIALVPNASRTAVVVAVGVAIVVVVALVLSRLVPQPLLIASALTVFLVSGSVARRFDGELGALGFGVVVAGLSWSFALWCSFRDFALWPGLVFAGVVGGFVVVLSSAARSDLSALHARLVPAQLVMMVLMVISWRVAKRGVVGAAFALVFVAWGALALFVAVVRARADDEPLADGTSILRAGADIVWNALVCWARLAPDDDDDVTALFGAGM